MKLKRKKRTKSKRELDLEVAIWENALTDACDWVNQPHRAPMMDRECMNPAVAARAMRGQEEVYCDSTDMVAYEIAWGIEASIREQHVRELARLDGDFTAARLLERVSIDVERLMRDQRLTCGALAARLRSIGCSRITREWVDALVRGVLDPELVEIRDLVDVFFGLSYRVSFRAEEILAETRERIASRGETR